MKKDNRHRKSEKHWSRDPFFWRLLGEFVIIVLALLALIVVGETLCALLGAPADGWPWFGA